MAEKFDARRARKVERLTVVAQMYREVTLAGSLTPAADIAERLGVPRATVRSWISRARSEGFLTHSDHAPRPVDWGTSSWKACTTCHVQWPCTPADAGNWES